MKNLIAFLFLLVLCNIHSQNIAPTLIASGHQIYCPQTAMPIVSSMSITDPDDIGIAAMYIQISSGYVAGEDLLTLTGSHPNIVSNWNSQQAKLTLAGINGEPTYIQFIAAIESVVYSSSNANPSGSRTFSITVGSANYLESTGHYYEFIPNVGISWIDAKNTAATLTYFGLQGYLATITSTDEVQISSIQSTGAGWIGGTDEAQEGVWRWATGPEAGTIFWNGGTNGTTPNFAYWNNGEPNNLGNEDYAHVTAPGVGILGSWNDLKITGENSGDYQPKGFIVEYGGMPGDPILNISTTSVINMVNISVVNGERCENGSVTLEAFAGTNSINWYTQAVGGSPIFTGNIFNTPFLNQTTIYYVAVDIPNCTTNQRQMVTANIYNAPIISITTPTPICPNFVGTINVQVNSGQIKWYAELNSTEILAIGSPFFTPALTNTTAYYYQIDNNGCLSPRYPIDVVVLPFPSLQPMTFTGCENTNFILNAGSNDYIYSWSNGESTPSIVVNQSGTYVVNITSANGCSGSKTFNVDLFPIPIIDEILVDFEKITIQTANEGLFLYSIDGINFSSSNVFYLTTGGLYQAYVKDINDCGIDIKSFVFLSFPSYFTPNNDGYNDFWQVNGLKFLSNATTYIYDRFGKLIKINNAQDSSWDGRFNNQDLPSSDYWYVIDMPERNQTFKGHFSLKR
jgi:gliding motility-associated-like protein